MHETQTRSNLSNKVLSSENSFYCPELEPAATPSIEPDGHDVNASRKGLSVHARETDSVGRGAMRTIPCISDVDESYLCFE